MLPGKVGGTEIYVRNMVKWLEEVDNSNEYFVYINKESIGIFEHFASGIKVVLCPIKATNRAVRILWEQIILPMQIKFHKIDILLSAGMTCPFICPVPSVLVIHDLQHINQPQNFARHYLLFLKFIIYLSAKSADGIITISKKVKQDIISYYKIKPEDISVIYHAADSALFHVRHADDIKAVRVKYGLPENFLLYTASSLAHKNHKRLLEAFKIIRDNYNGMKLVLTGARDYGHDIISNDINRMGLGNDVIFLGWLPFEDMPAIYCSSRVFIFPSLHEGFGIPLLEAMACGVPVVCSDIEPLNEVAGDAALFIDPYDPYDIAEGVSRILRDIQLRESLINKGYKKAGEFSWERTALNTLSTLHSYMES